MRRYADPVDVRTDSGEEAQAPTAFLWRGRLYVVRAVLGHWRERRSWWSSAAARMVHGEGGAEPAAVEVPDDVHAGAGVRVAELAEEREVWRVSAAPGRSFPGGVYDLCKEPAAAASRGSPADIWRLVRVAD
ncbi:MAG: DUF6504 family protein [Kineosporiaceae bacterium]